MKKIKIIRSIQAKRAQWALSNEEIAESLRVLTEGQREIRAAITDVEKMQLATGQGVKVQLDRLRPSRPAWISAIALLIASAGLVIVSALATVGFSSDASEADSIHQQAQADRVAAVSQLIEDAQPSTILALERATEPLPIRDVRSVVLKILSATATTDSAVTSELNTADRMDANANKLQNTESGAQPLVVISLGIGSALFGALLGWVLNQVFAEMRWRRETRESGAN